jgi:dTDP-4-dehydrorhamnose reductase
MQLAGATARLIQQYSSAQAGEFPSGLYHATAAGSVSWCGFARAIVEAFPEGERFRLRQIVAIGSDEYPTPARRPLNSVLCNGKFERSFGFRLGSWQQGLADTVREIRQHEGNRNSDEDAQ